MSVMQDISQSTQRTSFSDAGRITVTVELSSTDSRNEITLANIPLSMTIGELKQKLNVELNSHLGRPNELENWDNRRQLSDYLVKDFEQLVCVKQSNKEDGQSSFDDYDQWLAKRADGSTK